MNLRVWQARFREYLQNMEAWSAATIEGHSRELKPFFEFLSARPGWMGLSGLTREILEDYRGHLAELSLAVGWQNLRFDAVKAFARFLFREQCLLVDITQRLDSPRYLQTPRGLLTELEVSRLLQTPDCNTLKGLRDRAILEAFYELALRDTELRRLNLEDVDRGVVRLPDRSVAIGGAAKFWLDEYLRKVRPRWVRDSQERALFLSFHGRRLDRGYLRFLIRSYAQSIGLEKFVSPNALRRSRAAHLLARGIRAKPLQTFFGNAEVRVQLPELAEVLDRYHPLERGKR